MKSEAFSRLMRGTAWTALAFTGVAVTGLVPTLAHGQTAMVHPPAAPGTTPPPPACTSIRAQARTIPVWA